MELWIVRRGVALIDVEEFLRDLYGNEISQLVPLGKGEWSKAFSFRRAGRDYVIRFGAYLDDFAKDRLAASYAGPALPIPPIIELGETAEGYYAIAERVFGSYIDDADEDQMRRLLPALFASLDAMRAADLSRTSGYGGWGANGSAPFASWRDFLLDVAVDRPMERVGGWRARLAASDVGIAPFDGAYAQLRALAESTPAQRSLIHSDLLHWNVLVDEDRITGVLDWGCGLYGDFLYDLAWLCFWQPWYPAWQRIDFKEAAVWHYADIGLDVPHFEDRLRCCELHIGLSGQAYQAWIGDWDNLRETARRTLALAR